MPQAQVSTKRLRFVYFFFTIFGIGLTILASIFYSEVTFVPAPDFPIGDFKLGSETTVELSRFSFWVYPSVNQQTEDELRHVRMDLDIVSPLPHLIFFEIPGIAEDFSVNGYSASLLNETYDMLYDETVCFFQIFDGDLEIHFDWKIFARESYDEYGILVPLFPEFSPDKIHIQRYEFRVSTGPDTILDLSKTFPTPHSYTREHFGSSFYSWEFSHSEIVKESEKERLIHVLFRFPNKRSEKERTLFNSGVLFGLGTSSGLGGFFALLELIFKNGIDLRLRTRISNFVQYIKRVLSKIRLKK